MDRDLSPADILAAPDAKVEAVAVPEWGGTVHLRTMSGTERDAFEREMLAAKENLPENFRAKFLCRVLCTRNGEPLGADAASLGKKSGEILDRLFKIAQRLNAMDGGAQDRLGNG